MSGRPASTRARRRGLAAALGLCVAAGSAGAQPAGGEPPEAAAASPGGAGGAGDAVTLDLREPIPLQALLDYVAAELGWSLLYDPDLLGGEFRLSANAPVPRAALPGLLDLAMRQNGLALVHGDPPGFKRVVAAEEGAAGATGPGDAGPGGYELRSFKVRGGSVDAFAEAARAVLSTPENLLLVAQDQDVLLVADRPAALDRVQALADGLEEGAGAGNAAAVVPLRFAVASDVADAVREAVSAGLRASGRFRDADNVSVSADPRTNQVVVSVPPDVKEQAVGLIEELDRPVEAGAEPVRRYPLTNTTAREMLRTLRSVAGQANPLAGLYGPDDPGGDGFGGFAGDGFGGGGFDGAGGAGGFGGGGGFGAGGFRGNRGGGFGGPGGFGGGGGFDRGRGGGFDDDGYNPGYDEEPGYDGGPGPGGGGSGGGGGSLESGLSGSAKVRLAADVNTNSIIVVADPAVQAVYAELIAELDERRPQVQIEATLVSLNTTDDYSLGVEFGTNNSVGGGRLVSFSSFGVSGITPLTGSLVPGVAAGVTASLLDADFADVVLRAFAQDSNARVLSSPTLLVNDNEKGLLQSIREEPTLTVSQGEVTNQISFAGYVKAGTQILVTPHISDGGYLQLEYKVEVNSFRSQDAAQAAAGVPPPRQTDGVQSMVTIPDGATIVVGGLTRTDDSEIVTKVPLLGDIPLLGALFRQTNRQQTESTLFVFLRPKILVDEDFGDLRGISEAPLRAAGLPGNEPVDAPDLIRE